MKRIFLLYILSVLFCFSANSQSNLHYNLPNYLKADNVKIAVMISETKDKNLSEDILNYIENSTKKEFQNYGITLNHFFSISSMIKKSGKNYREEGLEYRSKLKGQGYTHIIELIFYKYPNQKTVKKGILNSDIKSCHLKISAIDNLFNIKKFEYMHHWHTQGNYDYKIGMVDDFELLFKFMHNEFEKKDENYFVKEYDFKPVYFHFKSATLPEDLKSSSLNFLIQDEYGAGHDYRGNPYFKTETVDRWNKELVTIFNNYSYKFLGTVSENENEAKRKKAKYTLTFTTTYSYPESTKNNPKKASSVRSNVRVVNNETGDIYEIVQTIITKPLGKNDNHLIAKINSLEKFFELIK